MLSYRLCKHIYAATRAFAIAVLFSLLPSFCALAQSTGPVPFRQPVRFTDSTSNGYQLIQMLKYSDTLKVWLERNISGSTHNAILKVRDDGKFNGAIYSALSAVNRGADSTTALIGANTTGEVFASGRRVNSATNAVTGTFNRFFKTMNDSSVWFTDGTRALTLNSAGLLVGGATQDSQLTIQKGGHLYGGLKVGGNVVAASFNGIGSSLTDLDGGQLVNGTVLADKLTQSSMGISFNMEFTATDYNTVTWTAGTLKTAGGGVYSIVAGSTGDMAAQTYIYFNVDISSIVLQVTSNWDVVAERFILLCIAKPAANTDEKAFFVPKVGYLGVNGDNIAANSIKVNQLAANAVTAAKISSIYLSTITAAVDSLSAIRANLGKVTAGQIVIGGTNKLWLNDGWDGKLVIGGSDKATAPFQVDATGKLTATNATLKSSLTGDRIEILNGGGFIDFYSGVNAYHLGGDNGFLEGLTLSGGNMLAPSFIVSTVGDNLFTQLGEGFVKYRSASTFTDVWGLFSDGSLKAGSEKFQVDANGNLVKIRNVSLSWPSANTAGYLYNNGSGTLTWESITGSGITSLNGLTPSAQTFAKNDDSNVTLAISSSGSTHTFTMGWTGVLGIGRGGTNNSTYTNGEFLKYNSTSGKIESSGYSSSSFAAASHAHAAGDITSGTVSVARGGTGADLSGTGGTGKFVKQTTLGGPLSVGTITAAEGGTTLTSFTGANYLLYSTSSSALATLAPPGAASVLTSNGGAPAWTGGYPTSALGSPVSLGYVADALGGGGSIEVFIRTITINGVTIHVLATD